MSGSRRSPDKAASLSMDAESIAGQLTVIRQALNASMLRLQTHVDFEEPGLGYWWHDFQRDTERLCEIAQTAKDDFAKFARKTGVRT